MDWNTLLALELLASSRFISVTLTSVSQEVTETFIGEYTHHKSSVKIRRNLYDRLL